MPTVVSAWYDGGHARAKVDARHGKRRRRCHLQFHHRRLPGRQSRSKLGTTEASREGIGSDTHQRGRVTHLVAIQRHGTLGVLGECHRVHDSRVDDQSNLTAGWWPRGCQVIAAPQYRTVRKR